MAPDSGPTCPVCGSPGRPIGWRGLNLLYRCGNCGQTYISDSLGTLEADLRRNGGAI